MNSAVGQQSAGLRNLSRLAVSFLAADTMLLFAALTVLMANCFFMIPGDIIDEKMADSERRRL